MLLNNITYILFKFDLIIHLKEIIENFEKLFDLIIHLK